MRVRVSELDAARTATISIQGRFDFSVHQAFRDAYRELTGCKEYRVDLGTTEYMDSSALGMLLLLKEHADSNGARVVLEKPSANIRRILEIANFDKLFAVA